MTDSKEVVAVCVDVADGGISARRKQKWVSALKLPGIFSAVLCSSNLN